MHAPNDIRNLEEEGLKNEFRWGDASCMHACLPYIMKHKKKGNCTTNEVSLVDWEAWLWKTR